MQPQTGACLCGAVTYQTLPAVGTVHCHCRMCQRATGSAFATWVPSPQTATIIHGPVAFFQSTPTCRRGFCPTCGSTILMDYADDDLFYLALGTLDDPNAITPVASIWTRDRLSCVQGCDTTLKQYPEGE